MKDECESREGQNKYLNVSHHKGNTKSQYSSEFGGFLILIKSLAPIPSCFHGNSILFLF